MAVAGSVRGVCAVADVEGVVSSEVANAAPPEVAIANPTIVADASV